MHRVTWKWCLHSTEHRSEQASTAGLSPTRLAPGDICALCVLHAQTARQIQTRVEVSQRRGSGERPSAARCAYVIRSFLLSLHWGYLGLGLGMVTSPGYLLSSRASWKGSKSSGCGQNTASGPQKILDTQTGGCVPPRPPPCPNLTLKITTHSRPEDANPVSFKEHLWSMRH